ncbi:MAG: TonB-dependent receptor [Bacteroidetes bacterium HLUCCA01]|nr:MAG: TonB-dependent receptor [Bacteroidetes bacterium HLUCCA01]
MRTLLLSLLLLVYGTALAQSTVTVSGTVTDYQTGSPLPGATILVEGTTTGTAADLDGSFTLRLTGAGEVALLVRSVGYVQRRISVQAPARDLSIRLQRSIIDFDEVIVTTSPTGSGATYQPDRAFSGEELTRRRDVTIAQMLDGEPGVSMRSFGPAPARPVIRGFDGERILVLENGERMGDIAESSSDHLTALDPHALQRLEVVRGPASLLYGTSALGGVINMITNDIPTEWSDGAEGTVSSSLTSVNEMVSGYGRVQYGLGNHALTARASYRAGGDLRTPKGRLTGTSLENFEGSAGYGFTSDNSVGGVSISGLQSVYGIPEGDAGPGEGIDIRLDRVAVQGNLELQRDGFFDAIQLKFHTSVFNQDEVEFARVNNQRDETIGLSYAQQAYSISGYFQHKPAGMFDRGVIGFNVNGRVLDIGGQDAFTPGEQFINPALFAFQEVPVSQRVRMQLGLRLDYRTLQARTNSANPDIDEARDDLNLAGSFGLNYRPADQLEMGWQVARAHRYPTAEELFSNGAHLGAGAFEIGNAELQPEIGYGADAFMRYRTRFAEVEVAAFVNFINGFIAFQPTGQIDGPSGFPVFVYESTDARLMGGEAQAAFRLNPDWSLTTGVDYVHGTRMGGSTEPLPFMPPFRFRAGLDYTHDRLWGGIVARYTARQGRVAPAEAATDGYMLVNLNAGYRFGSSVLSRVVVRAENIFNVTYRDHLSRVEDREAFMPARNISLVYSLDF